MSVAATLAPALDQQRVAQLHRLDRGGEDSAHKAAVGRRGLDPALVAPFEQHPRSDEVVARADHDHRLPAAFRRQPGERLRLSTGAVGVRVDADHGNRGATACTEAIRLRPGGRPSVRDDEYRGDALPDERQPLRESRPAAAREYDGGVGSAVRASRRPDEQDRCRDRPPEHEAGQEEQERTGTPTRRHEQVVPAAGRACTANAVPS